MWEILLRWQLNWCIWQYRATSCWLCGSEDFNKNIACDWLLRARFNINRGIGQGLSMASIMVVSARWFILMVIYKNFLNVSKFTSKAKPAVGFFVGKKLLLSSKIVSENRSYNHKKINKKNSMNCHKPMVSSLRIQVNGLLKTALNWVL